MSRFPFLGPPMPGLGNPEERRSIPTVRRPRLFGNPSRSCAARGVGAGTASKDCVATGDAMLGDCDAEGDERDRLDDDDDVFDVDERDDLPFLLRCVGRADGGTAGCADGCCEM